MDVSRKVPSLLGVPIFISDLINEYEIRIDETTWPGKRVIVIGRKVDIHALLYDQKLTEDDRQFLRQIHVSTETKSAYER